MNWKHFATVYTANEEKAVSALIDAGIDPCAIKTEDGPKPGTVKVSVLRAVVPDPPRDEGGK